MLTIVFVKNFVVKKSIHSLLSPVWTHRFLLFPNNNIDIIDNTTTSNIWDEHAYIMRAWPWISHNLFWFSDAGLTIITTLTHTPKRPRLSDPNSAEYTKFNTRAIPEPAMVQPFFSFFYYHRLTNFLEPQQQQITKLYIKSAPAWPWKQHLEKMCMYEKLNSLRNLLVP